MQDHLEEKNPGLTVAIVEWDLAKPDFEVLRDDLAQVTDTSINYAGTPVKLKSAKYEQAILVHNAAILGDMRHKVSQFGHHLDQVQVGDGIIIVFVILRYAYDSPIVQLESN